MADGYGHGRSWYFQESDSRHESSAGRLVLQRRGFLRSVVFIPHHYVCAAALVANTVTTVAIPDVTRYPPFFAAFAY